MFRRYAASLILVPVLVAAWLTFRTQPVTGLPLNRVAMCQPAEEADAAEITVDSVDAN